MRRALAVWMTLWAVAGCAGTSTGNPFDPDGTDGPGTSNEGGQCDETRHDLAGLDADTPLGFRGADLLALADGSHPTELSWTSGGGFVFGPESGSSGLTIEVSPRDSAPRHVERSPATGAGDNGGAEIALVGTSCAASLEVDVRVHIQTEGGALDETFDATLSATSKNVATLFANLKQSDMHGTLALEPNAMGFTLDGIQVSMRFAELGVVGSLSAGISQKSGANGVAASVPLARWPAGSDSACQNSIDGGFPTDLDKKLGSFSAADALALAARAGELQLTWQGGGQTALALEFSANSVVVCAYGLENASDPQNPRRLVVAGTAHVKTADQRIDGRWPLLLSGISDAQGALARVELAPDPNGALINGLVDSSEFESTYGFHGVDLGAVDKAAADLKLQLTAAGTELHASGAIQLRTAVVPECVKNPPQPMMTPGGGVAQAGCAGYTFGMLEAAAISD